MKSTIALALTLVFVGIEYARSEAPPVDDGRIEGTLEAVPEPPVEEGGTTQGEAVHPVATGETLSVPVVAAEAVETEPGIPLRNKFFSDPPARKIVSIRKELNAYKNYGVSDKAADILYSGECSTWTFAIDPAESVATAVVSLALDDHYGNPADRYSLEIRINGQTAFSGPASNLRLEHGAPLGETFSNWKAVKLPMTRGSLPGSVSVEIRNTSPSSSGDWMAVDWIELRQ
jgi:hypothetical protein